MSLHFVGTVNVFRQRLVRQELYRAGCRRQPNYAGKFPPAKLPAVALPTGCPNVALKPGKRLARRLPVCCARLATVQTDTAQRLIKVLAGDRAGNRADILPTEPGRWPPEPTPELSWEFGR